MTPKFIAIIQTGQTITTAREKHGDFDDWFIQAMGTKKKHTRTYRVFEELNFPEIKHVAGIIITGSSAMVTDEEFGVHNFIQNLPQRLSKNISRLAQLIY